ncbi:hypothetical protein LINGRAHAP2_LOCUS24667 [Linum grandiflorum]
MAPETKQNLSKLKPGSSSNQDGSNRKRIASSSKQPADSRNKSVSTVTRTEVKTITTSTSKATSSTTTKTTRVREKKVFSLTGQRYDPPEEVRSFNFREPLRIFYESLSEQIPNSEMAEFW